MYQTVPASLRFNTQRLSQYARNRVKINVTTSTANPTETIIFELSPNQIVDLSTISLHATCSTTTGGSGSCFIPPTNCLIQQATLNVGGVDIMNIDHYNQLYKMLQTYTAGDAMGGWNTVDGQFGRNTPVTAVATGVLNAVPICMKNMLMFTSGKCLDLSLTGAMRVTLRLAPTTCLTANAVTTAGYSLTSMSVHYDVITLDPVYQQMSNSLLSGGGTIPYTFTNYVGYLGSLVAVGESTNRVPCNAQSLDYILHTCLGTAYNTVAAATFDACGFSTYFLHGEAASGITGYQVQIGSTTIPSYRLGNAVECMSMTGDALGKTTDLNAAVSSYFANAVPTGTITANALQNHYTRAFFVGAARLCHGNDYEYGVRLLSGIDTRGANVLVSSTIFGTGANVFPLTFLQMSSTLQISANRQLMFIQ